MATENIAEGETRARTGTETGSMGTGIGNVMATGIESVPRDETIGEETMVVAAASALVVGAVGGSSRNIDGTTIGAGGSSNVMTSADIVVGAKTARLLVEAIEDGRRQGRQRAGRRLQRGCVMLSRRRRKASGWDVHAPGYEQYSAMQAKQTGRYHWCLVSWSLSN